MLFDFKGTLMNHTVSSSKFYAYLSRLLWIKRWDLMRNAEPENVMEHSWEVAVIAHALALIRNEYFMGQVDANAIVCDELISLLPDPLQAVYQALLSDMQQPESHHQII